MTQPRTFTAPAALVNSNSFGGSLYPTLGLALEAACEQWLGETDAAGCGAADLAASEMLADGWLKLDRDASPDDEGAEVEVAAVEAAMARVLARL